MVDDGYRTAVGDGSGVRAADGLAVGAEDVHAATSTLHTTARIREGWLATVPLPGPFSGGPDDSARGHAFGPRVQELGATAQLEAARLERIGREARGSGGIGTHEQLAGTGL